MAKKKNEVSTDDLTKEEIEAKQKELAAKIRTAPISEIAHKIKNCSEDGGRRCTDARFAVFLGAGASFQANIKTAGQMMTEFREHILKRDCPEIIDKEKQEQWLKENVFEKGEGNDYSKLFEAFERTRTGRQKYISKLIKDKIPTFGYAMLASIIARGFINTILTTNFDDLMFIACNKFTGVRPVIYAYGIMATEMKFSSPHSKILKMHGDYLYSTLANTEDEMSRYNQDPNMKAQVAHALNEYELIVFGYSGSDDSVMNILENYPDGKEFYWCHWSKELPSLRALELLHKKDGTLVAIDGFDEAMYDIYKIVDFELDEVLASYEERRSEVMSFIDEFDKKISTPIINEAIEERKISKVKSEREPTYWWEYIEEGLKAELNKNLVKAEEYYRAAIKADPDNATLYGILGTFLANKVNRWKEAKECYSKAIQLEPENSTHYTLLARLLGEKKEFWKEAEVNFRKAIDFTPLEAGNYIECSYLFYYQNRINEAIEFLLIASKLDANNSASRLMLASIYKKKGMVSELKEYIHQATILIKDKDFYQLAGLKSVLGERDEALKLLELAVNEDSNFKEWAKKSISLEWIRDDERFWEIVGRDDEE